VSKGGLPLGSVISQFGRGQPQDFRISGHSLEPLGNAFAQELVAAGEARLDQPETNRNSPWRIRTKSTGADKPVAAMP